MNNAMTAALKQAKAQAELVTHLQSLALKEEKKKCEGLQEKVRQLEAEVIQWKHDEKYNEDVLEHQQATIEKLKKKVQWDADTIKYQMEIIRNLRETLEEVTGGLMEQRNQDFLESFEPIVVIKPKKRDNLVIECELQSTRASEFEMLQRQTKRYNSWKK